MRVSIPGLSGVYYDTESESSAVTLALSAAGRRAAKPQGYALQLLPHLWSFDVDLREVPADHPIQYLHPEGARSLESLARGRPADEVGRELEAVLQFAWAVNRQVETAAERMVGSAGDDEKGVVIEIEDGAVQVDGDELAEDSFDVDSTDATDEPIEIEVEDETRDDASADDTDVDVDPDDTNDTSADDTDVDDDPDDSDVEVGTDDADESDDTVDEFDPSSDEFDPDA